MDVSGKGVVVTGGASGIGAALVRQLVDAGAQVLIADRDVDAARHLAETLGCHAVACDVTREDQIAAAVAEAETRFGQVDIFVSNAGLGFGEPDHAASATDAVWQVNWQVHVMAHVYAARACLPGMIARGDGYLVNMASAAGLLNQVGDAAYSATKHAAVSFAESLAIAHGADGLKVSVICPQYVTTPLIGLTDSDAGQRDHLMTAHAAAAAIMEGMAEERFLILTHPQVAEYVALRATDHARWLKGMQMLRARAVADLGAIRPEAFYKTL
ncbi:MAG: SDR family oxidoreductase [Rhodobacteraceae bacterium]|nr:SDR family oxidoreductase [Paracoccaceae bacterium]